MKAYKLFRGKRNLLLMALGIILITVSLILYQHLGSYAESFDAPSLEDVFHEILPRINVGLIATGGLFFSFVLILTLVIFKEPEKFSYIAITIAIFVTIRILFFSMTHLGAPHGVIEEVPYFGFEELYFTKDLFPSGHVGVPFLAFLMFRKKWSKIIMLGMSLLMAFSVLIMRLHYSIDVFGAFFVAYGIYAFSEKFMKEKTLLK